MSNTMAAIEEGDEERRISATEEPANRQELLDKAKARIEARRASRFCRVSRSAYHVIVGNGLAGARHQKSLYPQLHQEKKDWQNS